jgi:hypothetical protein
MGRAWGCPVTRRTEAVLGSASETTQGHQVRARNGQLDHRYPAFLAVSDAAESRQLAGDGLRSLFANAAQETAGQLARKSLSQAQGKGLPVSELTFRTPCVYNHAATVGWRPMRGEGRP